MNKKNQINIRFKIKKNLIQNRIRIKIYFFQIQIFSFQFWKNFSKNASGASHVGDYEKRTLPFSLPFACFTALSLHRFTTRKDVRIVWQFINIHPVHNFQILPNTRKIVPFSEKSELYIIFWKFQIVAQF